MDQFKGNDEEKQEEQERLLASLQKELSTFALILAENGMRHFWRTWLCVEEEVLEHYLESGEVEEADIVKNGRTAESISMLFWFCIERGRCGQISERCGNLYGRKKIRG